VAVEDDGCGIAPQVLPRIFDPFFTTKFVGRGLGLASVLGIARSHRGGVAVESTPGHGSRFEIVFPALSSGGQRVSDATEQDDPRPKAGAGS
jgi:two-component system cell cycle sensor histidine kinase/response regulator CckA